MKKYLILSLSALPLLFSSCLKEDKDLFDESASARVERIQTETEQVLNAAPNGWQMKYYPSSTQQYGGIMIYMKFDKGEVTVASEHGAEGETAKSLYSYDADAGATLNFDTYNPLFHRYSEPNSGVGEVNTGMDGDAEFVIVSYSSDEVVLRGKRTGNTIRMTPLPEGKSWSELMKKHTDAVAEMDKMLSYSLRLGGTAYETYRVEDSDYPSRYLCIVDSAGNTIEAPYIYTDTGLEFYRPIVVDGTTIERFDWSSDRFINVGLNASIAPVKSKMTFAITVETPQESDVKYKVSAAGIDSKSEYYYTGAFKTGVIDELGSDEAVIRYIMDRIASADQLASRTKTYSASNLKASTDYYILTVGIAMSSGKTFYPITGLDRQRFTTAEPTPYTDDYAAWLGSWTVTSTGSYSYELDGESPDPISFDITIEPLKSNATYEIYGWGTSRYRNDYPIIVSFNSMDGSFAIDNETQIESLRGGVLVAMGIGRITGKEGIFYSFVGGEYPLLTAMRTSATEGKAAGYTGTLTDGSLFEALFCDYFLEDEYGGLYLLAAAEGYTSLVYPSGPFTLTKKADESAAAHVGTASARGEDGSMRKIAARKEMFHLQ